MNTRTKIEAYEKLVLSRKSYTFHPGLTNPAQTPYDVNEIEPWAQWQNNLNAKILLVGQEFSDLVTYNRTQGKVEFESNKYNYPSNENLCEYFKILGFELGHPSNPNKDNPIFFTNAVMGLKTPPMSANFNSKWIKESRELFLKPLIDIIDPEIIIAVGAIATKSLARIYNFKILDHNSMVNNSPIVLDSGKKIFPVFHTGGLGLLNKRKELQIKDWQKIKNYL